MLFVSTFILFVLLCFLTSKISILSTMKLFLASGLACCLLIILVINVDAQCGMDVFVNVTIPEETVYIFEGSEINTTITVNEVLVDGVLTFRSSNPAKFRVRDGDATTVLTTSAVDLPFNITVVIEGRAISIESLEVLFKPSGSDELVELGKQTIGVKRIPKLLQVRSCVHNHLIFIRTINGRSVI